MSRTARSWKGAGPATLLGFLMTGATALGGPSPDGLSRQLIDLGNQAEAQGQLEQADRFFRKALELDPNDVPLRLMLGWIALQRGDTENLVLAERAFRDVIRRERNNDRAWLGLAETLERLGMVERASARAIASGERLPVRGTPEFRAAELERSANARWEEAVTWYTRCVERRTASFKALNGLQRTHALLGQYDQALDFGQRVLVLSERESDDFQRFLAAPELSTREEQRLRESERRARVLRVETHLLMADIQTHRGEPAEAASHLDRALALDPTRVEAYSRRARLRLDGGEHHQAIEDIDTFLRLSTLPYDHPDVRTAWALRGEAEAALRRRRASGDGS